VKTVVLDACALIAYLRDEPGAEQVAQLVQDPKMVCIAHRLNLIEVYYEVLRQSNELTARQALAALQQDNVQERADFGYRFLFEVGKLKASQKLSLADCFCLALARKLQAVLVTSDHHEFDVIAATSPDSILFIR